MAQQMINNSNLYQTPMTSQGYPTMNNPYNNWAAGTYASQNPYNMRMQEQYQQPQQQMQQNPQPQLVNSQRIWVQGESSAKAYLVQNNTEQVLWDSESPIIYIKTVDLTGKPSIMTLDYTIRNPEPPKDQNEETAALKAEISELKDMMGKLLSQNQQKNYKSKYKNGGEET